MVVIRASDHENYHRQFVPAAAVAAVASGGSLLFSGKERFAADSTYSLTHSLLCTNQVRASKERERKSAFPIFSFADTSTKVPCSFFSRSSTKIAKRLYQCEAEI